MENIKHCLASAAVSAMISLSGAGAIFCQGHPEEKGHGPYKQPAQETGQSFNGGNLVDKPIDNCRQEMRVSAAENRVFLRRLSIE